MTPGEIRNLWISHLRQPVANGSRINAFMNACLVADMEHHIYRNEDLVARARKLRQDFNDWVHNEFELKDGTRHPSEDESLEWIHGQLELIAGENR